MERIGIRQLKNQLSAYVARAGQGETILITDRGKPVARLAPAAEDGLDEVRQLARRLGSTWTGGKPEGLPADVAEKLFRGAADPLLGSHSLSAAIAEERAQR